MQLASSWGSLWMPLSLSYTAALLRQGGHIVKIIDCQAEDIDAIGMLKIVKLFNPSLAIFNTGFPSIKGDMFNASILKKSFPEIKTLAIGMYPTLLREKMFVEFRDLDFAIVGEPEWVTSKLAMALESHINLRNIYGLIFRENTEIIVNAPQNFRDNDMNELPFPARDLLNNEAYRQVYSNDKFTHINIARGCTYKCTFCNAPAYYGNQFRKRNIESIISEIEECVNKFGIKIFLFWAEEYTLENDFAEGLADAIINKDIHVTWYARARVDNISIKLLRKMKKAGCKGISLGIESINEEVHRRIYKGIKYEQIVTAINIAREAGIKTTGHFVFGLPGDTKDSALKTIQFAQKSGLDLAQFYCAVPYPGTKFGILAEENGWIQSIDYSRYHLSESISRNESLSSDQIRALRRKAYRRFYMKPQYFINALIIAWKHKSFNPVIEFLNWV